MRCGQVVAMGVLGVAALLFPRGWAEAENLRAHGTVGGAHALGSPQGSEFGLGATASASLEIPLRSWLGVEGKVAGWVLSEGDAPRDPSLAKQGTGTAFVASVGGRVRPFTPIAGPWASLGLGFAQTGDSSRLAIDSALGWDFRIAPAGRIDVGPFVGLTDIVQSDDGLRPNDAYLLSFGVHVGLGVASEKPKPSDRDGDTILDPVDACPDVPGVASNRPTAHGCPKSDRDRDTILDESDACPDVPGIATANPATHGCPPKDRDRDTVPDEADACPDIAGLPSDDPRTNGCPPLHDRDQDGIVDEEDACPDVPGVRTIDKKANGCPPASASVRVEADRILFDETILFDSDSSRVRRASWGIVKKLAEFMTATPEILEVSIEGHADATGTESHNVVLSRERADSVKRLLVQNGVDAGRIKAEALGRSRLKVQTQFAEAKNRRVEFWITRTRPGNVVPVAAPPSQERPLTP